MGGFTDDATTLRRPGDPERELDEAELLRALGLDGVGAVFMDADRLHAGEPLIIDPSLPNGYGGLLDTPDQVDRRRILVIASDAAAAVALAAAKAEGVMRYQREEELRELTKRVSDELPPRVAMDTMGELNMRKASRGYRARSAKLKHKSRARL